MGVKVIGDQSDIWEWKAWRLTMELQVMEVGGT